MKNQSSHQVGKQRRTPFSFYDPFVGFGQRGRFVPWLISNMGKHAETLRDAVIRRFVQRRIPGTKIVLSRQSNKGLSAETRNYYIVQRNSIRIGLYISRFGKDLYISMVTYFKGSINMGKVFILIVMVLLIIFYYLLNTLTIFDLVGLTSINNQTQGIQNYGSVLYLIYQTLEELVSGAG